MNQLEVALNYARNGIKVFPCNQDKEPINKNGYHGATTDEKIIKRWWNKHKDAYVAAPNKEFSVVDVDYPKYSPTGKILTKMALDRFLSEIVPDTNLFQVNTASGGIHYYFSKKPEASREICKLPNIDFLANGGYSILPDQKNYVCEASQTPWEALDSLPDICLNKLNKLSAELSEERTEAQILKKESKKRHGKQKLTKKMRQSMDENTIDYNTGEIILDADSDLYERSEKEFKNDPTASLLNEDGKLELKKGELNSDMVNKLFHNQEIQRKLLRFLGLEENPVKKCQRSVIPGHVDNHPSMSVRWAKGHSHFLIRDHSNFYGDNPKNLDYNVVRMYATMKYKTCIPRLSCPQFVVWFMKMLSDTGILDLSPFKKEYEEDFSDLSPSETKMAYAIQELDAIKTLYEGYDGTTTFADKFSSAWCEMHPSTASRAKNSLVEKGYINTEGRYDCSKGKRKDGFFNTKLYTIIEPIEEQEDKMAKPERENMMYTVATMPVNMTDYETLENFAEDFAIENMPLRSNMYFELYGRRGLHQPESSNPNITYYMGDLTLDVLDGMTDNNKILMIHGHSPALEELFYSKMKQIPPKETYNDDEPLMGIILSHDFDDSDVDMTFLESKLLEYTQGKLAFSEVVTRYETGADLFNYLIDGKEPIES